MNLDDRYYVGLIWYWLPLSAYAVTITYLSSLSAPMDHFETLAGAFISLPSALFNNFNDKICHIAEYAILGILTYRAIRYSWGTKLGTDIGLITVISITVFGCTDEFHQWFTPLRQVEGWDIFADALGGVIGVSLWKWVSTIPVCTLLDEHLPFKLQSPRSLATSKF